MEQTKPRILILIELYIVKAMLLTGQMGSLNGPSGRLFGLANISSLDEATAFLALSLIVVSTYKKEKLQSM